MLETPNKGVIESVVSSDDTMGIKGEFWAEIIDDTNVYPAGSNNSHRQIIILRAGKVKKAKSEQLFKVDIEVESYWFQSHAQLWVWSKENKWELVQSYYPAKMFNIDDYAIKKDKHAWDPMYKHFGQLIMDLIPNLH